MFATGADTAKPLKSAHPSLPEFSSSKFVVNARILLGSILATAIILPKIWQPLIDTVYDFLSSTALYRLSTFETIWTVFCYAAIEPYITYVYVQQPDKRLAVQRSRAKTQDHAIAPLKRPKGMRRPARRLLEAVTYVVPLLVMDLAMIKKFSDVSLEAMLVSGNYDPSMIASVTNSSTVSSYHKPHFLVPSFHNFTLSSPVQTTRAIPASAPSSKRLVIELIVSFVLYDALFFVFHLALHMVPLFKQWHMPHHAHQEIHPQITNKLSIFERLGLVLLANFSLNIIGSHVLTRTFFVPIFVWLLVEIHSGLDLEWAYDKILPRGWGGGAAKHAKHHEDGGGGLEPFFGWCDALLERFKSRG